MVGYFARDDTLIFSTRFFSLALFFSYFLFSSERAFGVDLGPTWCLGLNVRVVGRAPEVHPWVRDVGCPSEIHSVDVVVDQTVRLRTRIDPVHIAVARQKKSA